MSARVFRPEIDFLDQNIVIFGDGGSGKSTFLRYLLKRLCDITFWLWDYNWQHNFINRIVKNTMELHYESTILHPEDKSVEAFERFGNLAYNQWNVVSAIEEIQEYCTPHRLYAEHFIRSGRNHGSTYIAVTQRPSETSKAVLSNAEHRFVFRLTLPQDCAYVEKWLGIDAEKLRTVELYHFFYQRRRTNTISFHNPVPVV